VTDRATSVIRTRVRAAVLALSIACGVMSFGVVGGWLGFRWGEGLMPPSDIQGTEGEAPTDLLAIVSGGLGGVVGAAIGLLLGAAVLALVGVVLSRGRGPAGPTAP